MEEIGIIRIIILVISVLYLTAGAIIMITLWDNGDWGMGSLARPHPLLPLLWIIFFLEIAIWPIIFLISLIKWIKKRD